MSAVITIRNETTSEVHINPRHVQSARVEPKDDKFIVVLTVNAMRVEMPAYKSKAKADAQVAKILAYW